MPYQPHFDHEKAKKEAIKLETLAFSNYYSWLDQNMPSTFSQELLPEHFSLIAHHLIGFKTQHCFCKIELKDLAFVLTLDGAESDINILRPFHLYGIKHYKSFVSKKAPPQLKEPTRLKVAIIYFIWHRDLPSHRPPPKSIEKLFDDTFKKLYQEDPLLNIKIVKDLFSQIDPFFTTLLSQERLGFALSTALQAQEEDECQYKVRIQDQSEPSKPNIQLILSWHQAPRYRFLFRLAKLVFRHNLSMTHINATEIYPHLPQSTLLLSMGLRAEKPSTLAIDEFVRDLTMLKTFPGGDGIEKTLIKPQHLLETAGNFIRAIKEMTCQLLSPLDPNIYTLETIEQGFCIHCDLTLALSTCFELKFHPKKVDLSAYEEHKDKTQQLIDHLDTGNTKRDLWHKTMFTQTLKLIGHCLKTNLYCKKKTALSFRFDPQLFSTLPYDHTQFFPAIPYALFFIIGQHFVGFHIRFKDLARGGLRTILLKNYDQAITARSQALNECYFLSYTQQKKNKDIPEGGAKGIIVLTFHDQLEKDLDMYRKELTIKGVDVSTIEEKLKNLEKDRQKIFLEEAQRSFITSLLTLVNYDAEGHLRDDDIIDYHRQKERLYLGPDENLSPSMIDWIATYATRKEYAPKAAFISSKKASGINHKEYGVTSFGVHIYTEQMLHFLKIDPKKEPFTVKISGGPDGDVAGNQLLNFKRFFPKTAKVVALTDVSGTIFDPEGLNLEILSTLFHNQKPIAFYPPSHLRLQTVE